MISLVTLGVFSGAVLLLLLSPGPNMAFVISQGVAHGWRGGIAAALGIGVADLLLTALTAMGVTAVVASWPPAFDLIRCAGVIYLLWLVFKTLQKRPSLGAAHVGSVALSRVFLQAMFNSLLNPKALLFFMVFLPQFVRPEAGPIALQLLVLGGVLVATLTLGFPIEVQVGTQGRTGVYPSTTLPTPLYTAVHQSVLKDSLMGVWNASPALRALLVPDRR